MKTARLYAPNDLRLEELPDPIAGPGDLVLRVLACGTCGTDVKVYRFGHAHISLPRVIGHEVAGEVVALGDGVTGWQVGDRVQVIAAIPCGECFQCRRGFQTVCERLESIGYQYDGGFAELIRIPAKVLAVDGVNRIPDGLDAAEAAVTEPLENLTRNAGPVDAKSILGLLTLGASRGHRMRLTVDGADEELALADLVRLIEEGIGEQEPTTT